MIKKLRWKFILIAMCSMLFVEIVIAVSINAAFYISENKRSDYLLNLIADNNGKFPKYEVIKNDEIATRETEHTTRYFSVILNSEGQITNSYLEHIAIVSDDEIQQLVDNVKNSADMEGYEGNFKYLIKLKSNDNKMIIFIDCTNTLELHKLLAGYSYSIITISTIFVFISLVVFSNRIIKPVVKNAERQKQFITNAGHELKTPVAIILADAEVLEMKNKDDEWLDSIKSQAKRLDYLIKNLLELAKLGEENMEYPFKEFNISELLDQTIQSFNSLVKNCKIEQDIDDNIIMNGNYELIRELFSILIDNAIKYGIKGGIIEISLKFQGKNKIVIEISNEANETLTKEKCEQIFDRFYRNDKSRNAQTRGYGIGLSMADSIVQIHNGVIKATSQDNRVTFLVEFTK